MPIVHNKSDLFPDHYAEAAAVPPAKARGRLITATFAAVNAATDLSGSSWHLADVPADAIFDEATAFKVDGWGFATVNIGTKTDIDALVTVAKSAAATVVPVAVGDGKHGKPIWQALGLAAQPENNVIAIYAHAGANATAAGTLAGKIAYRTA